jgi:hypothetical protein
MVEAIGTEVDRVLSEVSRDVEQAVDAFSRASDDLADYLEKAMAPEVDRALDGLDQYLAELAEPVIAMLNR